MMNISGSPSSPSTRVQLGFASSHPTFAGFNHPATPSSALLLPARLTCTSTPATASQQDSLEGSNKFTFSPTGRLCRKPTPAILAKASDVFDISDSFMVMDFDMSKTGQAQTLSATEKQEKMSEDGE